MFETLSKQFQNAHLCSYNVTHTAPLTIQPMWNSSTIQVGPVEKHDFFKTKNVIENHKKREKVWFPAVFQPKIFLKKTSSFEKRDWTPKARSRFSTGPSLSITSTAKTHISGVLLQLPLLPDDNIWMKTVFNKIT